MHILLVRFSSMGDVILQTATMNWLHALFGKEIKISFLTSSEFASCLENHPHLNHLITFNRRGGEKWIDLKGKIRTLHQKEPIDLILDLHATLRSLRIKLSFWTIPALTVDKRRWERFFLTKFRGLFLKRLISAKIFGLENQVERILKDFETIFGDNRSFRRTQDKVKGKALQLTSLGESPLYPLKSPYIVLAPSASFKAKRWAIGSFKELAQKLLLLTDLDVVVLAGPDDRFCDEFNVISSNRFHNLQGQTSLAESMSILARAKCCVGNDSGMNHIAEAYGVNCVTIFGPTDPRFGFAPHGKYSTFLEKELWCRPCSTTGSRDCFREEHFCMKMISVEEVTSAVLKMLETL